MIRPCAVLQTALHPVLRVVVELEGQRSKKSNELGAGDGNRTRLDHVGNVVPHQSASPAGCERTGSNRRVTGGSRVPSHSATLAWSWLRESNPRRSTYQVEPPPRTNQRGGDVGSRTRELFLQGRVAARSTSPWHGRKESNPLPRIWNPRRCLSSTVWRHVRGSNSSHPLDRRAATPVASRGISSRPRSESNARARLRRPSAGSAGGDMGHSGESNPFEPGHNRSRCRSYCTMVEATRIERAGSCSQNRRAAIAHHLGAASSNRTSLSPSSAERFRQSSYRSASYRVRVSNPSGEGENLTTSRKSNAACSAGYFFGTACQGWSRRVESNHPGPLYE